MNLAMWSGPRNLSTALMYSFANRSDFQAIDEPFYACYLNKTGLNHPMRDAILAAQPHDAKDIIADLIAPHKQHYYQKHMTQHMLPDIPRDWIAQVTNVFLIRHPQRVLASFSAKYDNPTASDIGFQQQLELFRQITASGHKAVVIDSTDIRRAPRDMLIRLCSAIGLDFDPAMLTWNAGPKPYDGIWAQHWYGAVHASTGFAPPEQDMPKLPAELQHIADTCLPYYQEMRENAL